MYSVSCNLYSYKFEEKKSKTRKNVKIGPFFGKLEIFSFTTENKIIMKEITLLFPFYIFEKLEYQHCL